MILKPKERSIQRTIARMNVRWAECDADAFLPRIVHELPVWTYRMHAWVRACVTFSSKFADFACTHRIVIRIEAHECGSFHRNSFAFEQKSRTAATLTTMATCDDTLLWAFIHFVWVLLFYAVGNWSFKHEKQKKNRMSPQKQARKMTVLLVFFDKNLTHTHSRIFRMAKYARRNDIHNHICFYMWNSIQTIHHRLRCVPKDRTHFTLFIYRFFTHLTQSLTMRKRTRTNAHTQLNRAHGIIPLLFGTLARF